MMVPVFAATMMCLFEGNQQILNIYAEVDSPADFFMIIVICISLLTVFVAVAIGYFGYLAFGEKTKSVILFNLPNDDPASIVAKIFYVLTIMGSFVIVANPVFKVIEKSGWYRSLAGIDEPKLARQGSSMPAMNLDENASPEPKGANNLSEEGKSGN